MAKTIVATPLLMQPIAQFSFGMRAGDLVRIGATAGTDSARRMAGSTPGLADAAAQSARMLENFAISLQLLGASVADVVHIRSYLNDWRDQGAYEEALRHQWPDCRACHSLTGSIGFPLPQAAVEAEVLAVVGGAPQALPGIAGAVRAGSRSFFTTGPAEPGCAVPSDAAQQVRCVLERLEAALDTVGLHWRDIVMLNVNLADLRWQAAFDEAFRQRVAPPYPARTVLGTSLPDPAWLISLDAVAVAGGARRWKQAPWSMFPRRRRCWLATTCSSAAS